MTLVEYAGGATLGDRRLNRSGVVARAPEWWRKLADHNLRSAAAEKSPPRQPVASRRSPPIAGWVYGVACCGVSEPVPAATDKRTVCEQFTPAAFADMVKRAHSGQGVPLTWGHRGVVLASTQGLDLLFRVHEFYGLVFEARLRDTELSRRVLADLERGVLGVSVGYHSGDGWTTERRGFGTVRIIDRATLHHVALLPRDSQLLPAYRACWASGQRGSGPGCPPDLRHPVHRKAFDELTRQAKALA